MRPSSPQAIVAGLLVALLPASPWNAGLDPGWSHLLLHLWETGGIFGRDFVFTYGPLGPLVSHNGLTAGWWWVWKALLVFCAIGWAGVVRDIARQHGAGWAWYAAFATLLVPLKWAPWEIFLNLLLFLQLTRFVLGRGPSGWLAGSSGVLVAVLVYAKLSIAVPAIAGTLLAIAFSNTSQQRAQLLLSTFVPLALGAWLLPLDSGYITANLDIVSGYGPSMWLPAEASLAIGMLLGVAVWSAVIGWARADIRERLFLWALSAGFLLVTYRSGFTRADWGHQIRLVGILPLLPAWMLLASDGHRPLKHIVLTAVSWAAFLMFLDEAPNRKNLKRHLTMSVQAAWTDLHSNFATAEDLKALFPLPDELMDQIQSSPIDVFPIQLDLAYLNGLNLRTRPIPQAYSVYTSRLEQRNADHYNGPGAPSFVLFPARLQNPFFAIDGRPPFNDDFPALQVLRRRYHPVSDEAHACGGEHAQGGEYLLLALRDSLDSAIPDRPCIPVDVKHHVTLPLPHRPKGNNLPVLEVRDLELRWQHRLRDPWFRTKFEMPLLTAWMPDGRVVKHRLTPRGDGTVRAVLAFPLPQDSLTMLWRDTLPAHMFPDSISLHLPAHERKAYPADLCY